MAKKVVMRPEWIKAPTVHDLYSVSGCISEYFTDYIRHWKHNGYWLFDSAAAIESLAAEHSISLADCKVFYYEVYEQEFDDEQEKWQPFGSDSAFKTSVVVPRSKQLEGFDVVTFSVHTSPECSPLSCNGLAEDLETNGHCLFKTFEEAKAHVEGGHFDNSEPGPFRIFAVYSLGET